MPELGIKQFRASASEGCLSYVVFDEASRLAVVIDPRVDFMEEYRDFIADRGLKPVLALDTHIQADHFSATHLFRGEFGCEIGMSHRTESARCSRRLRTGDRVELGKLLFTVLETPGHTPDSLSLHGCGMVFTGDTLLIGSTGRTDFPGSDAGAEWDSLHRVLGALPGNTLVFPSHDYTDLLFSTIQTEFRVNAALLQPDRESFQAFKKAEGIFSGLSDDVRGRLQYNLAASPEDRPDPGFASACPCGTASSSNEQDHAPASIGVEKYSQKLKERHDGHLFVDVREQEEFRDGHMPGAVNIPLSELGLHLSELTTAKRIYLSCLSGRRSLRAARTLSYFGLGDVVNVAGGYKAWQLVELPIEKS